MGGPPVSYVLPLRGSRPADAELARYLRWLCRRAEVIVVDASPDPVWAANDAAWQEPPGGVRHCRVDPRWRYANGKVNGVLTGVALALHDLVVVADDDVRYDARSLPAVRDRLRTCDLVVPANYYAPLPWHARYDTARILLHRAVGRDFPGTLAVRASLLARTGGYDGDVLFENLELARTVAAAGGRVRWAPELLVARRPPGWRHLLGQRVRQAYDELARPGHLAAALAVLPVLGALVGSRRTRALLGLAAAVMAVAEVGRRRDGGRTVFPVAAVALAPLWVLERGCCAWLALLAWLRGGVSYRGVRLRRAATSVSALRGSGTGPSRVAAASSSTGREK